MRMLANAKPSKSVAPVEGVQLTLDDAGTIQFLTPQQDAGELFQMGQPLAASLHPHDIAFYEQTRTWFAAQQAASATIRLRLRHAQSGWVPTLATFQAKPGARLTVLLVLDDLAAAERREAKMRWIIEGSAQGVIVRSTTSLIYANESVARMLGYASLEDFKQHQTGEIDSAIHPDDLPGVLAATQARMERRDELSVHKFRYRRKDGSYMWLEATSRFVNWQGTPAETSWISDISERERAEQELIASKEEAEYANRSKTEFLANMSHELRTPLNAIIGFSEFMMAEMGGPLGSKKYAEYAGHIHESGQHLLSIINDILNLSRLEVGRLELDEHPICASALVDGCLALMRPRADEAGVTFAVEIPPDLPKLRADERAVKQILFNFLSNAVKFTPQGGRVTVWAREEQDGSFSLAVRDTGIGMSESEIAIAMAPFGQIDSKIARNHQGTGLGLPICESLMRLHGGALRIRSAPRQGTAMIASFPRERIVRETAQAASA
jgi:PAS domain S-box-containing protein